MEKATFLNYDRPPLVGMLYSHTPQEAKSLMMNYHYDGADAFCVCLEYLEPQYRTLDVLKDVFSCAFGKPIYITGYRGGCNNNDDECMKLILLGLEAGATLGDVMGDTFDPQPNEMTFDPEAVAKQREIIDRIHSMGKEVLISSHTHAFLDEDTVVKYALAQKERGADVVKIVNGSYTREQMEASFNMIFRLKKELGDTKFLFLTNGEYCRPIRQYGPAFGVCMYLCMHEYFVGSGIEQPLLKSTKQIRDNTMFLK